MSHGVKGAVLVKRAPRVLEFELLDRNGMSTGRHIFKFFCPACDTTHDVWTPAYDFSGDYERPTFSPRIRASDTCSVWCQSGVLTYASISKHRFAGKMVDLPPLDDW